MRTQILTNDDNKHAKELYYLPIQWIESDFNVLTMGEPPDLKRGLENLYQEAQEYDFLMGKSPQAMPDYEEEEVE